MNAALLSPEPMLTLPGTVTIELLLASETLTAPDAAAVRVTVQLTGPGPFTVAGVQVKLLI